MDFIVGLPNTPQQHDSICVIMDRLTKAAHFLPVRTTYTVKEYAELYFERIASLHGIPETIISDQGPQFTVRFWEQLHVAWTLLEGFAKVCKEGGKGGRASFGQERYCSAALPSDVRYVTAFSAKF